MIRWYSWGYSINSGKRLEMQHRSLMQILFQQRKVATKQWPPCHKRKIQSNKKIKPIIRASPGFENEDEWEEFDEEEEISLPSNNDDEWKIGKMRKNIHFPLN